MTLLHPQVLTALMVGVGLLARFALHLTWAQMFLVVVALVGCLMVLEAVQYLVRMAQHKRQNR